MLLRESCDKRHKCKRCLKVLKLKLSKQCAITNVPTIGCDNFTHYTIRSHKSSVTVTFELVGKFRTTGTHDATIHQDVYDIGF